MSRFRRIRWPQRYRLSAYLERLVAVWGWRRLALVGGLTLVALVAGLLGYFGGRPGKVTVWQEAAGPEVPPPVTQRPPKQLAEPIRIAVAGLLPPGLKLPSSQLELTDDDPAAGQLSLYQGEWLADVEATSALQELIKQGRPVVLYSGGLPNQEFLPPAALKALGIEADQLVRAVGLLKGQRFIAAGEDVSPKKGLEQVLRQLLEVLAS